ncbi:hypothetical protein AVEN_166608-1 [Araneus ventricosus]|uniref:Gem-associated protein 2 n=1 Tax=Araneus ventricosus TaxID=182803 RepID=A0A4Y2JHY6_ARAVE|nr:hypothetical protein AVEN_166608-1 [Araneus ventricosus]
MMSREEESGVSGEEDSGDELYQLTQKALFVEHPTRPINLKTVPRDGSEFIHKSRLEDANLSFIRKEDPEGKPQEENEQKRMRQWARKGAAEFSHYALTFSSDKARAYLKKKFPRKLKFPRNEPACIQEWCVFCLGSKLCSEIYGEMYEEPSEEIEGNLPFLSIIAHFNQYTAFTVLKNLHEWFLSLGMEESIGRWVYAVFACIRKPLDEDSKELIETFYNDCEKRLKDCDESERLRLYLISAILEYYFCVHSDKVGPTLESFLNLTL